MAGVDRKLKVMADYTAFPIWDCGDRWRQAGLGQAMVSPDRLPISKSLRERLEAWAAVYDAQDPFSEGWDGPPSEDEWVDAGRVLATDLQSELGSSATVVYFNELSGEVEGIEVR